MVKNTLHMRSQCQTSVTLQKNTSQNNLKVFVLAAEE